MSERLIRTSASQGSNASLMVDDAFLLVARDLKIFLQLVPLA